MLLDTSDIAACWRPNCGSTGAPACVAVQVPPRLLWRAGNPTKRGCRSTTGSTERVGRCRPVAGAATEWEWGYRRSRCRGNRKHSSLGYERFRSPLCSPLPRPTEIRSSALAPMIPATLGLRPVVFDPRGDTDSESVGVPIFPLSPFQDKDPESAHLPVSDAESEHPRRRSPQ
jgi:hypothetical protein